MSGWGRDAFDHLLDEGVGIGVAELASGERLHGDSSIFHSGTKS